MVQAAADAGLGAVSERLVTDWVVKGLLDNPERTARGKGRGRGAFYEWPDSQRDLFLTLLKQRPTVRGVTGLCPIPVGIWLYWGDEWVPLRQARLALQTWWAAAGRVGWDRSLEIARQVVDATLPTNAPRSVKSELRELVAGALEDQTFPREQINDIVRKYLGKGTTKSVLGPSSMRTDQMVDGMWSMVVAMGRYDHATDGMFIEARARLTPIILNYAQQWPQLSLDPVHGKTFEEPTWEFFINRSCSQLLIGLGLQFLAQEDGRVLGPVPIGNHLPLNKALAAAGIPIR